MNCTNCGKPLNKSQWNDEKTMKSCPACSQTHGTLHVFHDYPAAFGTTDKRASDEHPEGPQSHCTACRQGEKPPAGALCSTVKDSAAPLTP